MESLYRIIKFLLLYYSRHFAWVLLITIMYFVVNSFAHKMTWTSCYQQSFSKVNPHYPACISGFVSGLPRSQRCCCRLMKRTRTKGSRRLFWRVFIFKRIAKTQSTPSWKPFLRTHAPASCSRDKPVRMQPCWWPTESWSATLPSPVTTNPHEASSSSGSSAHRGSRG